jgi:dethiobiotin synthetase
MSAASCRGYFITGTDTGVGKTLVSAALLRRFAAAGARVAGMKPVASGAIATAQGLRNEDALILARESSSRFAYELINPCVYAPAIAPHLAAERAGIPVDFQKIADAYRQLTDNNDVIVVEGVGGWAVPLGAGRDVADLAALLGLPVILVVGLKLGCLNHARLTAAAIVAAGRELAGWIGSGIDPSFAAAEDNVATLQALLPAPCLGVIPPLTPPDVRSAAIRLELGALPG